MAALYTVKSSKKKPTLAEAAALLGVPVAQLDASFGVVAIDAAQRDPTHKARFPTRESSRLAPQSAKGVNGLDPLALINLVRRRARVIERSNSE
jgi:hypothetical protein